MVGAPNRPYVVAKTDEALADAISSLLADQPLRARLGAENRAHAHIHYDQETMFQEHDLILQGRWTARAAQSAPATPFNAGATSFESR